MQENRTNRRGELRSPADGQGCPSLREHQIYLAQCEILRYAQNDKFAQTAVEQYLLHAETSL